MNYDIWEKKHRPYVETLAKVNNSCVFVVEYDKRYLFASDNFSDFFGYDVSRLQSLDKQGNYLESRIHPEDLISFSRIQKRLIQYLFSIPMEKALYYKHIYEFRILNSRQEYVRVISQHQILETDENNKPWLILGVADLSPEQSVNEGVKFRLIDFKTGELIPFSLTENNIKLTSREREILRLINNGLLSKEISEKLSISIHTVNGHRQNILRKMEADNIMEALNYAKVYGLL